mmetsp:Transcript_104178/g.335868  ORF Transcript_104178/g.335868 Transcript_104178/m.335868 type:complete len:232 (+) Transcript_104178:118-813(+)
MLVEIAERKAEYEKFYEQFGMRMMGLLEKIRCESITDPEMIEEHLNFFVKITPDEMNLTITIEDLGIVMTANKLINNLGIIAKSGTEAFMEAMAAGGGTSMTGQSGIGFCFGDLVSDKTRAVRNRHDGEQHIWKSGTGASFTAQTDIEMGYREIKHGAEIVCHLQKDQTEQVDEHRLREFFKKYGEAGGFLTELYLVNPVEGEVTDPDGEAKPQPGAIKIVVLTRASPAWW